MAAFGRRSVLSRGDCGSSHLAKSDTTVLSRKDENGMVAGGYSTAGQGQSCSTTARVKYYGRAYLKLPLSAAESSQQCLFFLGTMEYCRNQRDRMQILTVQYFVPWEREADHCPSLFRVTTSRSQPGTRPMGYSAVS